MAEYIQSFASENVALNTPATFDASVPCTRGFVYHQNGSGIFILKGIPNCRCGSVARYNVTLNGNVAIPTGGAVTPIAMAITVSGELKQASKSIFTPAAVDEFGNITCTTAIEVPRGCCFAVAVEYVDATTDDPATTPTPSITLQNGLVRIDKVA